MYCIIHKENGAVYYLAWQNPVSWGEDGYFWTSLEIFTKCLPNNTKEHPFLFNDKTEAIKLLKSLNISQKCSVIKFKAQTKNNPFSTKENDCPLGGDITNDCADCAYFSDYHFVNGECIERGYEADVCNRGGDARNDCKYCAFGDSCHSINGECVSRNKD